MPLPNSVEQNAIVIELPERLVMAVASEVRGEIKDLIAGHGPNVVLDLGAVEFADSSGLSVLVSSLQSAKSAGGELVLVGPNPKVLSLIKLTRLHHVFQIFDSREAATASFS